MNRCQKFKGNKCRNCRKVGRYARDCWVEKKSKDKGKKKNNNGKGKGTDELNMVEEQIAFVANEEYYKFDMFDACNPEGNDERLILYDWLVDSAMTSHITQECEAFISYTLMENNSVTRVGGKEVSIAGHGNIELVSTCNGQDYILLLQNVLHVPRT
jgi:hypothetical protein